MDYKQRFFARYVSTHTAHRDGETTLAQFRGRAAYFQQRWRSLFPADRDAQIVDVGCGNGSLVWWLQSIGYRAAGGIDVSAEQVADAHRLGVKNIAQGDLLPFLADKAGCYDAIVMRDVLEHFTKTEILDILDHCFAALKSGGRLIIQVPNAEAPFAGRIRYGDFTHELAFSITSLQQLFTIAGFSTLRLLPTDPAVTGFRSGLRYGLWRAVAALYHVLLFAELGPGQHIVTQGIIAVGTKTASLQESRGA
jgi:2-polyprenyl-3-methyl-5-hydroxy-6-metoxy-1,4-benzoquinol methylase